MFQLKKNMKVILKSLNLTFLTFPVPIPDEERKLTLIYIFTHCATANGFVKALKALTKPFETPQRSVKLKI